MLTTAASGALIFCRGVIHDAHLYSHIRKHELSDRRAQALWALWTLASNEAYQPRVTRCGALGAAVTAISANPDDGAVQEQAIWCIYILFAKSWENKGTPLDMKGEVDVSCKFSRMCSGHVHA